MKTLVAGGLLVALFGCDNSTAWLYSHRYVATLPASGIRRIVLTGYNGAIRAVATDGKTIVLHATLRERDDRMTGDDVTLVRRGDEAFITSTCPSRFTMLWKVQLCDVYFTLEYPRSLDASLHPANGDVTVDGGTGNVDAGTTNGDVTVRGASSDVTALSHEGDVIASLAPGWRGKSVSLQTTFGDVELTTPPSFRAMLQLHHPWAGNVEGTADIPLGSAVVDARTVFGDIDVNGHKPRLRGE
jgi:hypothetical protein